MITKSVLVLSPEEAANEQQQRIAASRTTGIPEQEIFSIRILKRSIDARSRNPRISLSVEIYAGEEAPSLLLKVPTYQNVSDKKRVLIIGAGPAGMFAALKLIELGLKPIIIERGKDVRSRRRDLADINKKQIVHPDSNYCFGEGGAGTYSDGKLYTRSSKRGDVEKILNIFAAHGASSEILIDAHPHIGTNKLPKIIQSIREKILECGGEIHFNTKLTGFIKTKSQLQGCFVEATDPSGISGKIEAEATILATGHSARDIFHLLEKEKILIEAKPFALGLRIEHPQSVIDSIQYHCETRNPLLPAASYSLAYQVNGKGVYSFCMCPGGFIVPAATSPGEIVVNGMSPSRRDSRFANSGMVVSVEPEDVTGFKYAGALAFLEFQRSVEQKACILAGGSQAAPGQRVMDFISGKISSSLPETSYQPGLLSVSMKEVLPDFIETRLREGLKFFGNKMKGYLTNEAVLVGVESRTSSPVRIPRDKINLMHPGLEGFFPCGEGAGYAGGIVSAAMDGEWCAEKCMEFIILK